MVRLLIFGSHAKLAKLTAKYVSIFLKFKVLLYAFAKAYKKQKPPKKKEALSTLRFGAMLVNN